MAQLDAKHDRHHVPVYEHYLSSNEFDPDFESAMPSPQSFRTAPPKEEQHSPFLVSQQKLGNLPNKADALVILGEPNQSNSNGIERSMWFFN